MEEAVRNKKQGTRNNIAYFVPALFVMLAIPAMVCAESAQRYWVYLEPKAVNAKVFREAELSFSERAADRRMKNGILQADEHDVPVSRAAIDEIRETGVRIRQVSRWLNAISVDADAAQIYELELLQGVERIEPFRLRHDAILLDHRDRTRLLDDPVYGPSFTQNQICRVPELHARGLSGAGVLICFLDTGLDRDHDAFSHMNIIAAYDFIGRDSILSDEAGEDSVGQEFHGTATLSACGGYVDSVLIGPAFGADFMVAKTEWIADEQRFEEDNYVAALEWADSIGADITSSSLGYTDWYVYDDLNGHTAVTTRAAVIASQRGILVVTAAGNNRAEDWHFISTPADADSILAVGAVNDSLVLATFSSGGPTADGRIKPDVCAMGVGVFCANAFSHDQYFTLSGTSLSTPITAGIAALVMEAHPDWSAQDVRRAIKQTASQHSTPDNEYGWGIVDAVAAVDFDLDADSDRGNYTPQAQNLIHVFPNPTNGRATFHVELAVGGIARLIVYDILGREVMASPTMNWTRGSTEWSMDTDDMASGFYGVNVVGNGVQASGVFFVLK